MKSKSKKQAATSPEDEWWYPIMKGGMMQMFGEMERVHMQKEKAEEDEKEGVDTGPKWFYKLDIEIWRHIVSFLVPPRLKPLSGRTRQEYAYEETSEHEAHRANFATLPDISEPGCISREDIRAGDLATLMRTSIAFNHITADHLYRHICCDSLPLLLKGIGGLWPTHFGIDRKEQLLARTRTLQLEYLSKADRRHTSYITLMQRPQCWGLLGETWEVAHASHQAASEALNISDTLEAIEGSILCAKHGPYFPDLTHLSVGASSVATKHERPPIRTLVENCQASTMRLFQSSPIVHYCSRSTFGPYALPVGFVWGAPVTFTPPSTPTPAPTIPTFTFHWSIHTEFVRAAMGTPTRWLLENHDRDRYTTGSLARNFMCLLESHHEQVRKAGFEDPNFDIDIFISGSRYVPLGKRYQGPDDDDDDARAIKFPSPEEEKALVRKIYQSNYMQMRSAGMPILQGISSWRSGAESGGCEACGWEVEEIGEKKAERRDLPVSGSGKGPHHLATPIRQREEYENAARGGGKKRQAKGKGKGRGSK